MYNRPIVRASCMCYLSYVAPEATSWATSCMQWQRLCTACWCHTRGRTPACALCPAGASQRHHDPRPGDQPHEGGADRPVRAAHRPAEQRCWCALTTPQHRCSRHAQGSGHWCRATGSALQIGVPVRCLPDAWHAPHTWCSKWRKHLAIEQCVLHQPTRSLLPRHGADCTSTFTRATINGSAARWTRPPPWLCWFLLW
jgi:hypothetical protein